VALRQWLSPNLPLSRSLVASSEQNFQFGKILNNGHFGPEAVVETHSGSMAAMGWEADIRPNRTAAFTDTGHSEVLNLPKLDGSIQPEANGSFSCEKSLTGSRLRPSFANADQTLTTACEDLWQPPCRDSCRESLSQ